MNLRLKEKNKELEAAKAVLETALDNVKDLRGMLPIFVSCKKIRDDRGYWDAVEIYIKNFNADFSHCIFPECAAQLYPEYFKS